MAMAVARVNDGELDHLAVLAAASSDSEYTADLEHSHRINNAFHEGIALASGNQRLHRMIVQTNTELERFFYLEAHAEDAYPANHVTHSQIVAAMRKRDADIARQAIVEHIESTRRVLIGALMSGKMGRGLLLV